MTAALASAPARATAPVASATSAERRCAAHGAPETVFAACSACRAPGLPICDQCLLRDSGLVARNGWLCAACDALAPATRRLVSEGGALVRLWRARLLDEPLALALLDVAHGSAGGLRAVSRLCAYAEHARSVNPGERQHLRFALGHFGGVVAARDAARLRDCAPGFSAETLQVDVVRELADALTAFADELEAPPPPPPPPAHPRLRRARPAVAALHADGLCSIDAARTLSAALDGPPGAAQRLAATVLGLTYHLSHTDGMARYVIPRMLRACARAIAWRSPSQACEALSEALVIGTANHAREVQSVAWAVAGFGTPHARRVAKGRASATRRRRRAQSA